VAIASGLDSDCDGAAIKDTDIVTVTAIEGADVVMADVL
jgi:hypothetical protein